MRIVIIESPLAGDVDRNMAYARAALRDCLLRGEAPFASHLLYPQVLDDATPEERAQRISAGFEFRVQAVRCITAVYADLGISPGMRAGIEHAKSIGCPVEYRSLEGW